MSAKLHAVIALMLITCVAGSGASGPTPVIVSLSPSLAQAGSGLFYLTVTGLNFGADAVVNWNGTPVQTGGLGVSSLFATIPGELIASAGTASISITSNGATSGTLPFTITPAGVLTISSLSPAVVFPTGQSFTLFVTGSGFNPGTVLQWNGLTLDGGVDSSTLLHAVIPGNYIAYPGHSSLRAAYPNGLTSPWVTFYYDAQSGPTINTISPNSAVAGSQAVTVTIKGTNFNTRSVAHSTTSALSTSFVSSTQLNAIISPDLIADGGSFLIQVENPEGAKSNVVIFSVSNARPTLSNISPTAATAGDAAFTLTVNGTNFLSGATLKWNSIPIPAAYVTRNQLTASIPAALVANAGAADVVVLNPDDLLSNAALFTIHPRGAILSAITPSSAIAGGPGFLVTVSGSDFPAGSVVLWNGTALSTNYVSPSQLTATVPASLIATPGSASISVNTGISTTASIPFAINPLLPATSQAGIVNAFSGQASVAPGSLISIYGSNLASANLAAASTPLQSKLLGTSVSINGVAVPLLFVSPLQINGQVPYEIPPGNATMVIEQNGVKSVPVTFQVQATAPGILTALENNHVVAVNIPDNTLNSPQQPAVPGQYVTIYLTGQGLVDQPLANGATAGSNPLSRPLATVTTAIGGVPAEIQFAGLAPGFVGLMQINLKVPAVPAGEQNLEVNIGGAVAPKSVISVGAAGNGFVG
jgi:uncharacterized protein (TIGR03437 family)